MDVDHALSFCRTAGTYMRYRNMIVAILNLAKRRKWITELPDIPVRKDKKKKPREWITRQQWESLYKELPPHMQPMAEFAIETGLRQSNVLGLRWAQVSIERRMVWVEAEDTKADQALAVPLNDRALSVLESSKGKHAEWVFTYRNRPVKEIKTAFIAACVRAGIGQYTADGYYEGFTWHGFRHTWATWHVQNGTPLDVLQKLGGWSDLRMVMNYAQHSVGYLASFANNTKKE
jgi:integrase